MILLINRWISLSFFLKLRELWSWIMPQSVLAWCAKITIVFTCLFKLYIFLIKLCQKKRKIPAVFIHLPSVQIWYQVTQAAAHFCSTISGTIWLIHLHAKLNWNLFCHHNIDCHGYPPYSLTELYRSKKKHHHPFIQIQDL